MKKILVGLLACAALCRTALALPGAFQSLSNRVMAIPYAYVQVTGVAAADPNAWTMLNLSFTCQVYSGYVGTFDIYATPHGGPGAWMVGPIYQPGLPGVPYVPVNQGFPLAQSATAETGKPIDPGQAFYFRGGVVWDISVGFQPYLNVPH